MKEYIEERAVAIANYIIDYNATVRQAARKFGISKSTVHKDVAERLSHINPPLASRRVWYWTSTKRNAISGAGWRRKKNMSMSTSCARAAGTRNRKAGKIGAESRKRGIPPGRAECHFFCFIANYFKICYSSFNS